jgi:hypothetical protein
VRLFAYACIAPLATNDTLARVGSASAATRAVWPFGWLLDGDGDVPEHGVRGPTRLASADHDAGCDVPLDLATWTVVFARRPAIDGGACG